MTELHTIPDHRSTTVRHPLDRLTAAEIDVARDVVGAAGLFGATVRVAYLGLEEPSKADVLAWMPGDPVYRRIRMILLDTATGRGSDVIVSLTDTAVESVKNLDSDVDGHAPIILDEFMLVEDIVKADPGCRVIA